MIPKKSVLSDGPDFSDVELHLQNPSIGRQQSVQSVQSLPSVQSDQSTINDRQNRRTETDSEAERAFCSAKPSDLGSDKGSETEIESVKGNY